jgi:hypothetical protein
LPVEEKNWVAKDNQVDLTEEMTDAVAVVAETEEAAAVAVETVAVAAAEGAN